MQVFLDNLKQRGVTTVIMTWQEEYGQVPEQTQVDYRQLHMVHLLAYDAGEILKWSCGTCTAEDRAELTKRIQAQGLSVHERCRNINDFGAGAR
jgi:hypothetical protein